MSELKYFTDKRRWLLDKFPELNELEPLWGKYCHVPLDLPVYNYPNINHWIKKRLVPNRKILGDIAYPEAGDTNYDTVEVYPNNPPPVENWTVNLRNEFLYIFPDFMERLMEDFPFKVKPNLSFWSCNKSVLLHRDDTEFADFPSSFRIMLTDENPQQTLSLVEALPDQEPDWSTNYIVPRTEDSNSYVWNNLRTKHKSTYDPAYRKILLIIGWGGFDIKKYNDLMERSVNKYKDQLMVSKYALSDFVINEKN